MKSGTGRMSLAVRRPRIRVIRVGVDLPLSVEDRVRRAALKEGIPMDLWVARAANVMAMVALGEHPPSSPEAQGPQGDQPPQG